MPALVLAEGSVIQVKSAVKTDTSEYFFLNSSLRKSKVSTIMVSNITGSSNNQQEYQLAQDGITTSGAGTINEILLL